MSAGTKLFIAIVIIIAAGVVAWHAGALKTLFPQPAVVTPIATTTPEQAATTTTPNTGLPTNSQDTSDQALQQDTAALDVQMQGLSNDSAALDQSLNDQPVQQSY